jgi:branched-chain amino acid transport system permease protein
MSAANTNAASSVMGIESTAKGQSMSEQFLYFIQQMFNGVTLGSTYALIAIGYTMVYGIIGMINFAHGEVYMIGSYVSFIVIAALMMLGIDASWLLIGAAFIVSLS